jgi:hypothetical protein
VQVIDDQHQTIRIIGKGCQYAIDHRASVEPRCCQGRLTRLARVGRLSDGFE